MRTLLIDNHDSFTYNLFHYLAEVNGREPEVVVNDDPTWRIGHLAAFDNVVLSPGPGTPGRAADFGICREVVECGGLPTLGVCLGHQGLALLNGGRVARAPEPYHGRTSQVLHTRTGLFAGIPSPFDVVRYHSLAVDRLPPALEPTAWTRDGILMALRHRERPLWGVQFHPESIGSSYGRELLANFRDLSRLSDSAGRRGTGRGDSGRRGSAQRGSSQRGSRARRVAAAPAAPVQRAQQPPARRLRVLARSLPTRWTDEAAFDGLFRGGEHAYWLDSSRPDDRAGRFSIMGNASGPLSRVATADVWSSTVTVRSAAATEVVTGEFLTWLDRDLRAIETEVPELPFDFALGWVGYLGYELKAQSGGDPAHRSREPDAVMVFGDRALVLDHLTGVSYLLTLTEDTPETPRWAAGRQPRAAEPSQEAARGWLDDAAQRLAAAGYAPDAVPPRRPEPAGEPSLRHTPERYLKLIAQCQEEIAAGETYEVCLTNMIEAPGGLDPWDAYRVLRRANPAPYGVLLGFGPVSVLGTSPERFLKVGRDGWVSSEPIKGTRSRGATPLEDRELAAELKTSEKDRAENLMIVDLVRHDLGRCAEVGSVEADDILRVETYAKAHQLVSTVRAKLRRDSSAVDCVRAAFPPGSMTGAPKIRTMRIIDRLEEGPRGIYSGAVGYFSLTGAADLSVVIRTAVLTRGLVRYGVGGAIIALSDPDDEYAETVVKSAPFTALTGARLPHGCPDALAR
ncbi:aminodeoxychorismate synthase component I [Streptomyces sp. H27-D2]|uniref:aminodeoxychorismate synthase component I n=1 Tax=Streptomyces sp. H27-D2 TaxID=3046304 RepID=UPI002DBDEA9B|nr:aminodeoxychorismate synthase component I [Streptomyces sp. H27-D2]MEC4019640.1 aminodeoxychorismate synthase component I [Streptomyces sp. H27-D2]